MGSNVWGKEWDVHVTMQLAINDVKWTLLKGWVFVKIMELCKSKEYISYVKITTSSMKLFTNKQNSA